MRERLIDDFGAADGRSCLGTRWRLVADQVMGGRSQGTHWYGEEDGRRVLCMRGAVSLAEGGGFLQLLLPLVESGTLDAGDFTGVWLRVRGNGEDYNLHLKSDALHHPWQSYRAGFTATPAWRTCHLPFAAFRPHRVDRPLDPRRLTRLGVVAIGRAFEAELCLDAIGLYRD
ncbi:CIA30 family protein [Marichromatium gracile]|uniref:Complex I intermediate-associated protein 30 (CIA30) n=1 Tax=Marichromatium gracile TaxID=1048 RepID=A0A4R4ACT7_MARGR|nr:CIA30 family protein [Marichromatium gracile]MBK1708980.1 NADH:ubiquinone oxidoreductase [Marichromatium gracile]TCW36892.1 complex I intermediate-associated protein 30 (CIA30) [Marichromatium gracile]